MTCATLLLPGLLARHPSSPSVRLVFTPCQRAKLMRHPLPPPPLPPRGSHAQAREELEWNMLLIKQVAYLILLSALFCMSPLRWWRGFKHCNCRSAGEESVGVHMKWCHVLLSLLGLSIVYGFVSPQSDPFCNHEWREQDTLAQIDSQLGTLPGAD